MNTEKVELTAMFFGLSLAMLSIGFDAFKEAGAIFSDGLMYFLGITAMVAMVVYFILGIVVPRRIKD